MTISKTAAATAIALGLGAFSANAATITTLTNNTGSDPIEVDVTIEDFGTDQVQFTLAVNSSNTGNIADLRGFFFDYAGFDETAPFFSLGGTNGSDIGAIDIGDALNLGGGVNLNGGGVTSFDIGLEIGTAGIGSDDFQTFSFTFGQAGLVLREANFFDQRMGVRATSTGAPGSGRGGSSKVIGTVPEPSPIPLPAAGWMLLAGLGGIGAVSRLKKGKKAA